MTGRVQCCETLYCLVLTSRMAHMQHGKLRSTTSVFLSAWVGFLACLMGCAHPAFASAAVPECPSTEATNTASDTPDSCCEHDKRSGAPEKSSQPLSCCPLNATLHKQTTASAIAIPPPLALAQVKGPSVPLFAAALEKPPHHLDSGREFLLQSRVLRI
jgi:hypothetical protein